MTASVGADGNRHEHLLPHRFAAGLDAAFVVALAGPAEARFQQVVRRERGEPRRQRARAADEDPHDRRPQIVVGHASRHAVEMRKGADVPVEKTDLILPLVDPREVAARVHQPHQEEPRLAAGPVDVDQHLEEVDLGQIAGTIRQRHEDLAALPLPLRHRVLDDGHADAVPLGHQQLVQSRGGQPLFAARPPHRLGQQGLHPRGDRVPDRPGPRRGLRSSSRRRLLQVLANRDPCQSRTHGRPLAATGPPPALCAERHAPDPS